MSNSPHTCFWCEFWKRPSNLSRTLIGENGSDAPTLGFCEIWNRITLLDAGKDCNKFSAKLPPAISMEDLKKRN